MSTIYLTGLSAFSNKFSSWILFELWKDVWVTASLIASNTLSDSKTLHSSLEISTFVGNSVTLSMLNVFFKDFSSSISFLEPGGIDCIILSLFSGYLSENAIKQSLPSSLILPFSHTKHLIVDINISLSITSSIDFGNDCNAYNKHSLQSTLICIDFCEEFFSIFNKIFEE